MDILELKETSIRFGGLTAVAPLSLTIPQGQMAAIIGPNGAGKTTVFNLITGVYAPTSGEIWFKDSRVASPGRSLRPHQLARHGLARTFQNIRLFGDLTVADNVRIAFAARTTINQEKPYGLAAALLRSTSQAKQEDWIESETLRLLNILGMAHHSEVLACNLPYGDQRRLEITRALATQPELLLLDEPTSGMNPSETEEVTGMIKEVHRRFGLTVLLIEHHMSVVMGICDRVIVLDGGVKIADDIPTAIQSNPHVIAAYLGEPDELVDEAIEHQHELQEK